MVQEVKHGLQALAQLQVLLVHQVQTVAQVHHETLVQVAHQAHQALQAQMVAQVLQVFQELLV